MHKYSATHPQVTAVVIAGGLGSRMNSLDKALLQWRGRPFIEHIVASLGAQLCDSAAASESGAPSSAAPGCRIAINTNSNSAQLRSLGLPLLADPFPDRRGPLAGMLAGLDFSSTALTLFVPCDNPMLASDLLARLTAALNRSNADIAYASCGEDRHYLYALMRTKLRHDLLQFLRNGNFAVRSWYSAENAVAVDFSDVAACFFNCNNPADLASLPP